MALALASSDSSVVELTDDNFKEKTKEGFWLVEFFAPWCGHCKKLAPTWEHLAKELNGKANIAKVDCTAHKAACSEFKVTGFPTIKLLENGEDKEKYSGARTASAFAKFLKEKGALSDDVVVTDAAPAAAEKAPPAAEPEGPSDVQVLGADFEDKVKEGAWLVKFYAPWCGHCKRLVPAWNQLATQLKGKANIAKVDCTVHKEVCSKFGVKGYPTLKLIKDGAEAEAYKGGRDVPSLAKFLKANGVIADDVVVADLPTAKDDTPKAPAKEAEGPTDVVILTDDDFEAKTKEGKWLIKFYAPWCGHCKRLAPVWDELGTKVNKGPDSSFKVAKVDCTVTKSVCGAQGVKGYPTLKLLGVNEEPIPYRGGRDLKSLTDFLVQHGLKTGGDEAKASHTEL